MFMFYAKCTRFANHMVYKILTDFIIFFKNLYDRINCYFRMGQSTLTLYTTYRYIFTRTHNMLPYLIQSQHESK